MNNGSQFVGHRATLDSTKLVGLSPLGNRVEFNLDDIRTLYERGNNNAGDGLAIGVAVGGLIGVGLNAAYADETGTGEENPRGLRVVATYAAIGGLAGASIGSKVYSWESVERAASVGLKSVNAQPFFGIALRF